MLKGLFKDTAIYTIARFISFGLNIILIPIYVRFLGKAELGVFDLLNLFTSIITLTVALEIAQGVARFYPESTDKSKKKAYASTALIFSIIMYAIFSVVSWIFSSSFSVMLLNSEQYQAAFQITIISTFFRGLYNLLNNQLRYEVKPGMFAIVSIILIVSTAVISIVLVAVIQNGVYGLIYGQLVGLVITTVVELFLLRKHIGFIFDVGKFKEMLVFSLPLVVSSVGVFVTNSIDRLSISKIMTMEDVGLYGIGFRFASMIGVIFSGFQISLTPLIYSTYKNPDTPEKIAQIFRYFLVVVFILLFGISLYAKEILYFFTKPEYYSAWVVIPILAFSIILNNIYLFTPGMAISKKTGWIMLINIVAAVINTAGNILLIPKFGIIGAASANITGSVFIAAIYFILSQKYYKIPFDWLRTGVFLAILLTSISGAYAISYLQPDWNVFLLSGLKLAVMLPLCVLVLFAVLKKDELNSIAMMLMSRLKKR